MIVSHTISRTSLWKHFKFLDKTTGTINWRTNYVCLYIRLKLFIHYRRNLLESRIYFTSIYKLHSLLDDIKSILFVDLSHGKLRVRLKEMLWAMEDWIIIWMGNWCLSYGNRRCRKNTINLFECGLETIWPRVSKVFLRLVERFAGRTSAE